MVGLVWACLKFHPDSLPEAAPLQAGWSPVHSGDSLSRFTYPTVPGLCFPFVIFLSPLAC